MTTKFWKILTIIILTIACVSGFYGLIMQYNHGQYWSASFCGVMEYLLLNALKEVIVISAEEEEE